MQGHTPKLVDAASISIVFGAFIDALPHIAALFGVIWWAIRIYETDTVQRLVGRRKNGNRQTHR